MSAKELKVGSFYWVKPHWDVDAPPDEEWTNQEQPARYAGKDEQGRDLWQFIDGGNASNHDEPWGVRWVGEEIKP